MYKTVEAGSLMITQLRGLMEEDHYFLPVLSNASALLFESLEQINWAGFYVVRNGRLVLGPFQGKPACIHIEKGRGVCGTAWEKNETQRVADVHLFPGHIACDSASRSEIVIPLRKDGEVVAVLDIDSPVTERFTAEDQAVLEKFAAVLEKSIIW